VIDLVLTGLIFSILYFFRFQIKREAKMTEPEANLSVVSPARSHIFAKLVRDQRVTMRASARRTFDRFVVDHHTAL